MLPTIWGIYVTWIMYWYWIYHANTGGRNMSLKLYIPIGLMLPTICGVHVSHIYMLILEICCQQFGEYVSVEYIYWYWIYHANTWAMNVSWRVSVCPLGTGLGNVQFRKCLFVLEICCQQFGEYVSVEYICYFVNSVLVNFYFVNSILVNSVFCQLCFVNCYFVKPWVAYLCRPPWWGCRPPWWGCWPPWWWCRPPWGWWGPQKHCCGVIKDDCCTEGRPEIGNPKVWRTIQPTNLLTNLHG